MDKAVTEYMEGMIGELLSGTWGVPPEYKVLYSSWFAKHEPALNMLIEAAGEADDDGGDDADIEMKQDDASGGAPEDDAPKRKAKAAPKPKNDDNDKRGD